MVQVSLSQATLRSVQPAIVKAVTNYNNPAVLAELSEDLGEAMVGINPDEIKVIMESR